MRIESLCPVSLGPDNGGIVLDISEDGLAIQTIRELGGDSLMEIRVGLPSHGPIFQIEGQVAWTSESRKQAGLTFVGLPEQSREEIREWIVKQNPSGDLVSGTAPAGSKENRVVPIPSSSGLKIHSGSMAFFNKGLDFESMFPSERALGSREAGVPAVQPGAVEQSSEVSATPLKDWVANIEQRAKKARAKFGNELGDTARPEVPDAVVPTASDAEKAEEATSQDEHEPITSASATSILTSMPSTGMPEIFPRPVETDHDSLLDIAPEPQDEPLAASEAKFDSEIASPIPAGHTEPGLAEADRTVVPFPSPRETEAQVDSSSSLAEGPSALPGPLSDSEATEILAKSADGSSAEEMIAGLRAAIERRNAGKSLSHREIFNGHASEQQAEVIPVPVEPTPKAASKTLIASAVSMTPVAPSSALPVGALPVTNEAGPKELGASNQQVAEAVKKNAPQPGIPAPSNVVQPRAKSASMKRSWMPRGVTFEQAATVMLTIALLVGIGLLWRALKVKPEGDSANAGDSVSQRISDLTKAADELDSEVAAASAGSPVERAHATPAPSFSRQQPKLASSSTGLNNGPNNAQSVASASAPAQTAQQPSESPAQKEATASAPPPQTSKSTNSLASGSAPESGAGQKPNNDSTPASAPTVAPQAQVVSGVSTPSSSGGAGDRVVPTSLLYRVEPLYPTDAVQKQIEGTVKLTAVIGTDGKVIGLGVVSGPTVLVSAALSAAREWRYVPALLNGEPIETQTDITIEFRLPAAANP